MSATGNYPSEDGQIGITPVRIKRSLLPRTQTAYQYSAENPDLYSYPVEHGGQSGAILCCKYCSISIAQDLKSIRAHLRSQKHRTNKLQQQFREAIGNDSGFNESNLDGSVLGAGNTPERFNLSSTPGTSSSTPSAYATSGGPGLSTRQSVTIQGSSPVSAKTGVASQQPRLTKPPSQVTSYLVKLNNFDRKLVEKFYEYFQRGLYVDVGIFCEGKTIKCHRVVVCASSPFLHELLAANSDPDTIIFLTNMKLWEVQAIVEFMYTGEIKLPVDKVLPFLEAANTLQIKTFSGLEYNDLINGPTTSDTSPSLPGSADTSVAAYSHTNKGESHQFLEQVMKLPDAVVNLHQDRVVIKDMKDGKEDDLISVICDGFSPLDLDDKEKAGFEVADIRTASLQGADGNDKHCSTRRIVQRTLQRK